MSGGQRPSDPAFSLAALVLPFYLPSFLSYTAMGLVIPLLPLNAKSLGADAALAGAVLGMYGLGSLLTNVPAGALTVRLGKRTCMLMASSLAFCAACLASQARSAWLLGAAVFLIGAGDSLLSVSRLSFFKDLVPLSHRGRALSLLGGDNRFGMFIGPVAGGMLAARFGYAFPFLVVAGILGLVLACMAVWLPRGETAGAPAEAGPGGEKRRLISDWLKTMRDNAGVFLTAGLAIVLLQLVRAGRQMILPLYAESLGVTVEQTGLAIGAMFLAELAFFYPAGVMMDRLGRKRTGVPCLLLLSLSIAALPLAGSWPAFLAVCLAAGAGNGLGSGINMTLSTDYAPRVNPGNFIGAWRFIVDGGVAGGPLLVGAITAAAGLSPSALAVAGFGLVGAAVLAFTVKEPARLALQRADPK